MKATDLTKKIQGVGIYSESKVTNKITTSVPAKVSNNKLETGENVDLKMAKPLVCDLSGQTPVDEAYWLSQYYKNKIKDLGKGE